MNLILPVEIADDYLSSSQRIRVMMDGLIDGVSCPREG
jgi:hypothetical protein